MAVAAAAMTAAFLNKPPPVAATVVTAAVVAFAITVTITKAETAVVTVITRAKRKVLAMGEVIAVVRATAEKTFSHNRKASSGTTVSEPAKREQRLEVKDILIQKVFFPGIITNQIDKVKQIDINELRETNKKIKRRKDVLPFVSTFIFQS